MRRAWVLPFVSALCLFAMQGILSAQTSTFHASGEFTEINANINGSTVVLFAARGCTGVPCFTSNTILVFDTFALTPTGSVFIQGEGVIPDDALQADSPEHATLNVDTSQVPGFQTITCSFVPGSGFSCRPGPVGVIQIEWRRTQANSVTTMQETHTTSGPFITNFHQNQDRFSAASSGIFLGNSFTDRSQSTIGTNKDTTITLSRQN